MSAATQDAEPFRKVFASAAPTPATDNDWVIIPVQSDINVTAVQASVSAVDASVALASLEEPLALQKDGRTVWACPWFPGKCTTLPMERRSNMTQHIKKHAREALL